MPEVTVVEEVIVGPVVIVEEVTVGPVQLVAEQVFHGPPGGGGSIETVAAGAMFSVTRIDGEWPVRPTARTDVTVFWVGPDPSPEIVVPPSVAGMYAGDARLVPE